MEGIVGLLYNEATQTILYKQFYEFSFYAICVIFVKYNLNRQ